MTRFARAKGSKASNERVVEESTPWHVMKNQLLQKKNNVEEEKKLQEAERRRNMNYQIFLKSKEEQEVSQCKWAEFPSNHKAQDKNGSKKLKKKDNNLKLVRPDMDSNDEDMDSGVEIQSSIEKNFDDGDDDAPVEISSKEEPVVCKIKKAKLKKAKLVIPKLENDDHKSSIVVNSIEPKIKDKKIKNSICPDNNETNKFKKRKLSDVEVVSGVEKNKKNKLKKIDDSLLEDEKEKAIKKQEKFKKQLEKKKLKGGDHKSEIVTQNISKENKDSLKNGQIETKKKESKLKGNSVKKEKMKDGEFKRRKNFQPNKIIINGKEVEIDYFDNFPIKKEDAIKLHQLKKEMISKGLPRTEINRTLKLMRRRAEKELAREKKKVCFNCRKFGHVLSECQELSSKNNQELVNSTGTGICFKCGSTEHISFACKVVQENSFKFATCFICKEEGHISRQCPDNARGLYPKGGSCKTCGDVTHLKKDCPKFQYYQDKEQQKFQVETISGGNLEDLDNSNNNMELHKPLIVQNKIIKF